MLFDDSGEVVDTPAIFLRLKLTLLGGQEQVKMGRKIVVGDLNVAKH